MSGNLQQLSVLEHAKKETKGTSTMISIGKVDLIIIDNLTLPLSFISLFCSHMLNFLLPSQSLFIRVFTLNAHLDSDSTNAHMNANSDLVARSHY